MKKNIITHIILILLIVISIMGLVEKAHFQADSFFSIAVGNRIINYGFEETDQLVWHDDLEYIYLRWGFDVILKYIYDLWNFQGIYIFVLIMSLAQGLLYYFILNKLTKNKILSFTCTIISMFFTKFELAGRAQIISFLLFMIEFYCIEELMKTNKNRYFFVLLILPLLIVNFHTSTYPLYFVFYLPYIAEFILAKLNLKKDEYSKFIIEKRNIRKIVILVLLGILFGFCSPSGIDAYKYVFKVMGAVSAEFISEMLPVGVFEDLYIFSGIVLFISIMAFTKTKVRVTDAFLILGISMMAFNTSRYTFFFYLIASICVFRTFNDFIKEYNINLNFINEKIRNVIYTSSAILIVLISTNCFFNILVQDYINPIDYPINATNYILTNLDVNNIKLYNNFDVGGYLELNEIPVFMDSRAEMFTEEFNDTTILQDWYNVNKGVQNYNDFLDKYEITHALVDNTELIAIYICDNPDWNKIYQDDRFSIYERIEK